MTTPGDESQNPVDGGNGQEVQSTTGNESPEKPLAAMLEPMREDQVDNAVKFLSHPRVRGSPVVYRRSFLEKKGLTREEIDEAFRRVPDPPSDVSKVEVATTNQASQPKPSASLQAQATIQTPQSAASPVVGASTPPSLQQPRFHWSHALLAVGVLSASGAGTAVLFKKTVVPRLKAWIRKVVAERSETEIEDKSTPSLAEEAAEAAKAAASAAAVVAKASQELLDSRKEEKKYFEAFMNMIDVQVKEMKSMGEAIRKLETTREYSYSQDKVIENHIQSSTANGSTKNLWRSTNVNQSDVGPPPAFSKQVKVNGTSISDFGAVRPTSPASTESLTAPHPQSYMEIMAMIQRGEKPPGIKEINDMPPNPNQPPSKSLLTPRPKPWEAAQQRPNYGLQSQTSIEEFRNGSQYSGSTQLNERANDATEPGWRKSVKITEIEPEDGEQKQFSYQTESPVRLSWVPPQPPSVVMPEAAAAIRQPKSSVQKQPSVDEQTVLQSEDVEEEDVTSGSRVVDMNHAEIQEEHSNGIEAN